MGKYTTIQSHISAIFASTEWASEGIAAYPENFTGDATEFVRINILAARQNQTHTRNSVSGQLIIDIFYPAGIGPLRSRQIADTLDKYLANKSSMDTGGHTQLQDSTLSYIGIDSVNPSLCRYQYIVPFNYFGDS